MNVTSQPLAQPLDHIAGSPIATGHVSGLAALRPLLSALLVAAAAVGCSTANTPGQQGNTQGTGQQTISDFACLSGTGKIDCSAVPEVSSVSAGKKMQNNGSDVLTVGSVIKDGELPFSYTIRNTQSTVSAAPLQIESITFQYSPASPEESADNRAFECFNADGTKRCDQMKGLWRKVVPVGVTAGAGMATSETFKIRFKRFDDKDRSAKVTIAYRGVDPTATSFTFTLKTKIGSPSAKFQSSEQSDPVDGMNFPYVAPSTTSCRDVNLLNTGEATLTVNAFDLSALDPTFKVKLVDPAELDKTEHVGGAPWVLATPLEVAPGSKATLSVCFSPKDDKKKQGTIALKSNDTAAKPLTIQANSAVPCIKVVPGSSYNFGGNIPGTEPGSLKVDIQNCGPVDLVVTNIDFLAEETNSDEFTIDESDLFTKGKIAAGPPITATNPLKIAIGKTESIWVTYSPKDITKDETNPDKATIVFTSNAYVTPHLQVKGIGVEQTCPLAKVQVNEGEEVVPQTLLHLVGSKSVAPGGGTIKKYKWTVKQPAGSNQPLLPNATFANPTLQANAAGEYEFCLDVWDQNDSKSCEPGCVKVLVIPNDAIHVELLWDTPADPDQNDSGPAAGADMDLHFAHPLAAETDLDCDGQPDPWFSNPWDTFWFNSQPAWGSSAPGVKDDPTLDLDDTDGAGPENLNLVEPEGSVDEPVFYAIGVHYWNDHGYGTSYATVSIYIQGGLALQFTKVKMDPLDMWYVGKIWWPNTASGGSKKVFETCYQSGLSCPAKKNLMWQPKGDWCMTKCYNNKTFVGTVGGGAAASNCKP